MSAKEKVGSYRKLRLPDTRRITIDMLDATSRKHWMSGLIEVDVTRAGEALARMAGDERPPSLTTWVVFDDVDISVVIESERHGEKVPRPYVVRNTNSKSLEEISGEIEAFKSQHTDDLVLGNRKRAAGTIVVTSLGMGDARRRAASMHCGKFHYQEAGCGGRPDRGPRVPEFDSNVRPRGRRLGAGRSVRLQARGAHGGSLRAWGGR